MTIWAESRAQGPERASMLRYRLRTFANLSYNPLLIVLDIMCICGPNWSDTDSSEVQNSFTNPDTLSRF
jgi:hypothetical protein